MHATALQECQLCLCSWHTCIMGRLIGWLACCCAVSKPKLSGKPPAVVKIEVVRHWGSFVGKAVGCEMEVTMFPVAACSRTGQERDVAHSRAGHRSGPDGSLGDLRGCCTACRLGFTMCI